MRVSTVKKLHSIFDAPVYIITKGELSTFVDKFDLSDRKPVKVRYIVTDNTCTCAGFVNKKKCKHLAMLNNSYECRGISRDVARKDAGDIFASLAKEMPKSVSSIDGKYSEKEEESSEIVTSMELTFYGMYEDTKLIIIREFASGEYFIVLNIKTESKK